MFSSFPARAFAAIIYTCSGISIFFETDTALNEVIDVVYRGAQWKLFSIKFISHNKVRMLTRQIFKSIRIAKTMSGSALERIIENNKNAERTLDALKREVIVVNVILPKILLD